MDVAITAFGTIWFGNDPKIGSIHKSVHQRYQWTLPKEIPKILSFRYSNGLNAHIGAVVAFLTENDFTRNQSE